MSSQGSWPSVCAAASLDASASSNAPSGSVAPLRQSVQEIVSEYITLPATASKLRRLKADDLRAICNTAGIEQQGTKAVYIEAIMNALPMLEPDHSSAPASDHREIVEPTNAHQNVSRNSPASERNASFESPTRTDHSRTTLDDDASGSSLWDAGYESTDTGEASSGEDDVWGAGRHTSEITPEALAKARELMDAAMVSSTEAEDTYVDPFASTVCSALPS